METVELQAVGKCGNPMPDYAFAEQRCRLVFYERSTCSQVPSSNRELINLNNAYPYLIPIS